MFYIVFIFSTFPVSLNSRSVVLLLVAICLMTGVLISMVLLCVSICAYDVRCLSLCLHGHAIPVLIILFSVDVHGAGAGRKTLFAESFASL